MEVTGRIENVCSNYATGQFEITLSINEKERLTNGYDKLKDEPLLDIRIKKYRKKRSLDANAYFHVLVDRLADVLRISKPRCKNLMIGRYGQPFLIDDSREAVIKTNIPAEKMLENESVHCMPCGSKEENGQELVFYKIFRGSSTYDTKEMSILIDGTAEECKEQGIETMPPDELKRMLEAWDGRKHSSKETG